MKKFLGLLIFVFSLLFIFTGCGNDDTVTEADNNSITDTQSVISEISGAPEVYAVISNPTPAVGEEVTVSVKLRNAALFSSIDLHLNFDENALNVAHVGTSTIPNIVDNLKNAGGKITYGGFVLKAENVADATLFELSVTPKAEAVGTQTIQVDGLNFLLALDTQGNETVDKTSELQTQNIVLNIR